MTIHGSCGKNFKGHHCGGCHEDFSGIVAFDRHQQAGPPICRAPETVGLVQRDNGVWGELMDPENRWWEKSK